MKILKKTRKQIIGMGNAVLDVIVSCDEALLKTNNLKKGRMTIVDQSESDNILKSVQPIKKSSGGSVANTMAGIAILGGNASFCGKVKSDLLGTEFINNIKKSGVKYLCEPSKEGSPTARCLVFVTKDGERTMQTFLGASIHLGEKDIKEDFFKDAGMLYIEGYLWSSESARKAIKKAVSLAKKNNVLVIFSLSDSGLVNAFKQDFLNFIKSDVDILIGNEWEFFSLSGIKDLKDLSLFLNEMVSISVMTNGDKGAILFYNETYKKSSAFLNKNIIDSTGAGDMFAAGFLSKYNEGIEIEKCVNFGCEVASRILSQYGARPSSETFK
ncbi:MAG: adenosine kinase [Rickettsiales bacterium]|nr:adenosine kinase [Rickettsiales bacterium]|tara:strand:+ start:2006 stop:2986 length:981 start_codon:yes stop_codon:yes gene_type:complete